MKKNKGIFKGKIKVSADSKYMHGKGIDEDIEKTKRNINLFKHELETVIDMCYERHVNNFKMYETAVDITRETLREKFIEYGEKL